MKKSRPASKIGRKRRAAGWALIVLGMLVAGVWLASKWWWVDLKLPALRVTVGNGVADIAAVSTSPYLRSSLEHGVVTNRDGPFVWYLGWSGEETISSHYVVSFRAGLVARSYRGWSMDDVWSVLLWPIAVLLWIPGGLLLRSGTCVRQRATLNACATCGYSLAGLGVGASCPECGGGRKASEPQMDADQRR